MSSEYIDICEKFIEMEDDLNLFSWKAGDIYIWELIRFDVFNMIMMEKSLYQQAHTKIKKTFFNNLKVLYSSAFNFIFKNPFSVSCNKIIFIGHPRRKLEVDQLYWDIYCDPIIEMAMPNSYLLEGYYLNGHLTPPKTKNIYYLDFVVLLSYIIKVLLKFFKKNDNILIKLQNYIKNKFNIDINLDSIYYEALYGFISKKNIYKILFKKIKPKKIFILVGYRQEGVIAAAKELFIPVAELQHGAFSKYHMGYNYPIGQNKHYFPDYFLTFGDFWKNIANLPIDQSKILTVGYPYLTDLLQKYKTSEKKNTIIFISQGSIGKYLSKFAMRLRTIIPDDIDIVYKLHPGEYNRWKQEYPWLLNNDINVVSSQPPDLYHLFSQAICQIGVYSTAIYEGLAFGCLTYLVDLPGVAYMENLLETGFAHLVTRPEEIRLDTETSPIDTDYFFANDWQENLKHVLFKIKEGNRM